MAQFAAGSGGGSDQVIPLAFAYGIALLVGAVLGVAVRWLLRGRTHLGWAASVLSGIFGAFLGTLAMGVLLRNSEGVPVVLGIVAATAGTVAVLLIATRLSAPPPPDPAQLVAAGESSEVEFKSTARCNLHTGKRDERIELVIAKTVAALANARGGQLLIGVADDGTPRGLADDLALMKKPDTDRYELWLRDYLTQTIGAATTTALSVAFPTVAGVQLCWVTVPAASRPVYVVPNKSQGPQMWVRVGNSTRQLPLDQALAYATDRWGRRRLRVPRN